MTSSGLRGIRAVSRVSTAVTLVALLLSCSEPAETDGAATDDGAPTSTAEETHGSAAAPEETGPDPASGVLAPGAVGAAEPPPDPRTISLEPAAEAPPDPAVTAEAPASAATAYWGRRGPNLDATSPWRSIAGDGIHDRTTEAVRMLQNPRTAFRNFPRANSGNLVDWVAALDEGHIRPRGERGLDVLDLDVLLVDTKTMPHVVFPHRPHTQQLVCGNCHDWLFKKQAGSTDITMASIARGGSCGLCHGRVAFPATECFRCHNGPRPK